MIQTDLAPILVALQTALGTRIICGQITLNVSDGAVQSVETKTFQRVARLTTARNSADSER